MENNNNLIESKIDFLNINADELSSSTNKVKFLYKSKELFVEELAMEYYKDKGYDAIWSENDYWWVIYALLFWNIIFMKTDTCTSVPMKDPRFDEYYALLTTAPMIDMPHDFFKPTFYTVRKQNINQRLDELMQSDLSKEIEKSYNIHYGKYCRPIEDWDKYTLNQLTIATKLLSNEQIISIMHMFTIDFSKFRSGFPDLIVFNDNNFFFVEVKSKNDTLSQQQINNHDFIINNMKVNLTIFSVNKTDKQITNLKKKYETLY